MASRANSLVCVIASQPPSPPRERMRIPGCGFGTNPSPPLRGSVYNGLLVRFQLLSPLEGEMPPSGGRGGYAASRKTRKSVPCRGAAPPLCQLALTSPPQGGRGALRPKESAFLLLASGVNTAPSRGERGAAADRFCPAFVSRRYPHPLPLPSRAGLSHMAEISSVCARIERSVLAKGNFGIRKCVAATDPNPKIPYAIPLPSRGRGADGPCLTDKRAARHPLEPGHD
ncbi:Uncharacterised protein [Pannonibacter phragmitetus]|uniref:Uncharacterized protein n=1 Tax=Pannonibacter phragmitetus TaxID=121719 RepID=A0A378ZZ19_9HYPH|nr:Uncharacterised protein [Pannonibacter phragmitetus]